MANRFRNVPTQAMLTLASVSISANGDNTILAVGSPATPFYVFRLLLLAASAVNIVFKDGSTALSGAIPVPTTEALVMLFDGEPWFTVTKGNAFVGNLSTNVQVTGMVYYTTSAPQA